MEKGQSTVSAVDDFLGDLGKQEVSLNQEVIADTQVEVIPEIEEEKLPFHKMKNDPKFQKFLEKEVKKQMGDIQPARQEQVKEVQDSNPYMDYAEKLMGSDTDEAKLKSQLLAQTLLDIEKRASETSYNRFTEEQRQSQLAEARAVEELSEGLERIEENFDVDLSSTSVSAKKMRNEFLDFVGRISPKDRNGEVIEYADLDEAFETFKEIRKPEKNDQAKQIASRGMSRSSSEISAQPIKRITFDNVRELMGLE